MSNLKSFIENTYNKTNNISESQLFDFQNEFLGKLNKGEIRAAEPSTDGNWKVNEWVKKGILILFSFGKLQETRIDDNFKFYDKHTIPLQNISLQHNIRLVPGGSSIRSGAYVASGVICMPPMYINIGAYIDEATMIDSHALAGTCCQIGKRVHISAASQIGGVLEPPNARPVIIEDDVLVGGNCGIYEGVLVRKKSVIAAGVILTSSTKVFDLVNDRIIKSESDIPLEIPENAVVVPGSRSINTDFGKEYGLSIYTPLIIKYRDDKTNKKVGLEELLR